MKELKEQVADLERKIQAKEEENVRRQQILKKLGNQEEELEKSLADQQRQFKKRGILKDLKGDAGYNFVLSPNAGPKKVTLQPGKTN